MRELRNQLGTDRLFVVRARTTKKSTAIKGFYLDTDGTFKRAEIEIVKDSEYLTNLGKFVADTVGTTIRPDPWNEPLDRRQSVVVDTKVRTTDAATAVIDPNAPLFEADKSTERPITSEWWFWAAVAGGVGLLGGGVWLLLSGQGEGAGLATGTVKVNLHKVGGN
jgi:hypothetical protein